MCIKEEKVQSIEGEDVYKRRSIVYRRIRHPSHNIVCREYV